MEKNKVIRSAFMVGGFTSVSRLFGLVRDFLTAGFFGTSLAMSAFVVAFRIPNLFRALFGEGALSAAFIPVFVEARRAEGEESAWWLARKMISLIAVTLLGIVLVGVLAATVALRRPDLGPKAAMILSLGRIMLPYMLFICLAALSMGILNSYHAFALPAATPSLLNIVWILFVLFICPRIGTTLEEKIYGLAWGVLTAGVVQLAVQLPALIRRGYRPGFALDVKDARVLRVFKLMGPAALGLAVTQVNVMINSLLATWIGPWAPASLFYAERLLYFPQGILATAMSTVLLPVFAGHAARADHGQIRDTLNHSLRTLLFVMAPAAVGLLVLARPIIQMIYQWGNFTTESTMLTARALMFYAPGLFVFCLAKSFVPAFYATQDTRTPVRIGLCAVALNFTLNITFILTLPLYWKHAGLALAMVISEGFNGLTLAYFFHRRLGSPGWRQIVASAARATLAAIVMGLGAFACHAFLFRWGEAHALVPKLNQIISVLLSIAAGMVVYFVCAKLLRCSELDNVLEALRRPRRRREEGMLPRVPPGSDGE
ncbi:MAG: murein biosynthesis integral membrane protein MurJ [Kiritimatiellae bacterium]|nr:murein biosynthesis integral membrane protein MurJ [Kiritimatiellia bacterium]